MSNEVPSIMDACCRPAGATPCVNRTSRCEPVSLSWNARSARAFLLPPPFLHGANHLLEWSAAPRWVHAAGRSGAGSTNAAAKSFLQARVGCLKACLRLSQKFGWIHFWFDFVALMWQGWKSRASSCFSIRTGQNFEPELEPGCSRHPAWSFPTTSRQAVASWETHAGQHACLGTKPHH